MSIVSITKFGKSRRLRSIEQLRHNPNGRGKGTWHSLACLWAYKRKSRRLRLIADASRRRNRGQR